MQKVASCTAILLALIIAGCNIAPQQPGEAIAFGYISHKALTRTVTDAVRSGAITADQAQSAAIELRNALAQLQLADQALEANDPALAGDATAQALSYLRLVESLLTRSQEAER